MAGFYKTLVNMIVIVSLLLAVCVCVDYATNTTNETTITNMDQVNDSMVLNDSNVINDTHYIMVEKKDKITPIKKVVIEKPKLPIVSMWARPSVRCNLPYKWFYRSFIDYCPHCRRYNVLYDAHKWQARYEHEWTCRRCGADYDAVIGKEKYSWSHYYLRRA